MRRDRPATAEIIEEALLEAAAYLSNSIGEAVPLHDYRASVEVLASALSHAGDRAISVEALLLSDTDR
jgi:hypothetical protein